MLAYLRPFERLVNLENRLFDWRSGIDAGGLAEPDHLSVEGDSATGFTYVGSPIRLARSWLRNVPDDPERYTFVDMGSGRGRVLAAAAAHGFGGVIGVEFARELHRDAERNARSARKRGLRFHPVLGDAGEFAFPEGPLVVHFNNPFAEPVMARVVSNLASAYHSAPRPMAVVYQQQVHEEKRHATRNTDILDEIGFLQGRALTPRGWIDRRALERYAVRLYETAELRSSQ